MLGKWWHSFSACIIKQVLNKHDATLLPRFTMAGDLQGIFQERQGCYRADSLALSCMDLCFSANTPRTCFSLNLSRQYHQPREGVNRGKETKKPQKNNKKIPMCYLLYTKGASAARPRAPFFTHWEEKALKVLFFFFLSDTHMPVLCAATAPQPPQRQDNAAFAQRIHRSFTNLMFPPMSKALLEINIFTVSFNTSTQELTL